MQWKTVCFQCLQKVYYYHYPANNILFKEDFVQSEASPTRFNVMVFFGSYVPYIELFCVFNLFHLLCVALSRYVKCNMLFVDVAILFLSQSTLNLHCVFIKLAFESCLLHHVYIFDVVDIARSSQNRFYIAAVVSCLHCRHC